MDKKKKKKNRDNKLKPRGNASNIREQRHNIKM